MLTALDARGQPARTDKPPASCRPHPESGATRLTRRIHLTRDVAKHLDRYVPAITAKLRGEFDTHRAMGGPQEPTELDIDLSHATEVPQSQLTLLLTLLRSAIGNGTTITLSGVRPMVLNSLTTHGLPDDVVVVDTRGRQWANAH